MLYKRLSTDVYNYILINQSFVPICYLLRILLSKEDIFKTKQLLRIVFISSWGEKFGTMSILNIDEIKPAVVAMTDKQKYILHIITYLQTNKLQCCQQYRVISLASTTTRWFILPYQPTKVFGLNSFSRFNIWQQNNFFPPHCILN